MKTQTIPSLFDNGFFPIFRARTAKSEGGNGFNSNSQSGLKPRLDPAGEKDVSVRKPVRRDNSGLPASLKDWLACKAALEISRRSHNGTANGDHTRAWAGTAKMATDAKNLPTMSLDPQMG